MFAAILKLIPLIISAIEGLAALIARFRKGQIEDERQGRVDDVGKAIEDNRRANEETDDAKRLREKAEAVCRMEKAFNPSSDCDAGPRS